MVIHPSPLTGIARFFGGVRQRTAGNLSADRVRIGEKIAVVLYANRDITKGERMQYDYNGDERKLARYIDTGSYDDYDD